MSDLARLAEFAGIGPRYRDAYGRVVEVEEAGLRAILAGLGLPATTPAAISDSLRRMEDRRGALVAALLTAEAGKPFAPPLHHASDQVEWRLTAEDGSVTEDRSRRDGCVLPPLAAGYHKLHVACGDRHADALVIVAPPRSFLPDAFGDAGRGFGLTAQVHSLRSARDLGIGDLGDVAALAAGSGRLGATFLGLSPLHSLFQTDRTKISPYSPASRLFIDPLFIDLRAIAGFSQSDAARHLDEPAVASALAALRAGPFVDHRGTWALKEPLLRDLWRQFGERDRPALERFRAESGQQLILHATFESLAYKFAAAGRTWLGDWPAEFQDAHSDAVHRYKAEAESDIAYYVWLQWLADTQLGAAQQAALDGGMPIGLYRDLAVGGDRGGSEVWAHPERFAATLSVGAPPDPLGPLGQNWGLPPFQPLELERQGLAAFRALVAANMRHAGAIRIDHAFQLRRLFLIPDGAPASAGAYVDYPFEAMLAVLRLESHRARSLVIAEDLGTAPEGFSDAIMHSGLLSYRILSFEREHDGRFKSPGTYPRDALAAMTTHDLPTFAGWWRSLDIDLKETFGIYDRAKAASERRGREQEIAQFCAALADEQLLASPAVPHDPPLEATLRYLSRANSILTALQIEDVLGEVNQANLPGPELGHPNWRRQLAQPVEAILAPGGMLAKLSAAMVDEGRHIGAAPRLATAPPTATYRLQFHEGFGFDDAARIVPYLARLGISHVYASPIGKARPGSTHGYDNVDPSQINPELGGAEAFERFSAVLRAHRLGLLLDIVPNHMGVGGADNAWWLSVLEWGEASPFADTFDIDWQRLGAHGKLVAPFLGSAYGEALEKGELKLTFDAQEGSFSVWHYEHRFPICPLTYPDVIDLAMAADAEHSGVGALARIAEELQTMAQEPAFRRGSFVDTCEHLKRRLTMVAQRDDIRRAIEQAVTLINGTPGRPESFGPLHRLLERQAYRLAFWRVASSDINYRRFFDIDGLAGIRIEEPAVFERAHAMIFDLVRRNRVQGLRIDHIDGLAEPKAYVDALQSAVGPGFYVVAEKILEPGEALRPWQLAGTTGYDMLNVIDGVFVDTAAEPAFDKIYADIRGRHESYEDALHAAKSQVLYAGFASELEGLVSDLKRVADADRRTRDYTANAIRTALGDLVIAFPVYRSYITPAEASAQDRALVDSVIRQAKEKTLLSDRSLHDFAGRALTGELTFGGPGQPSAKRLARFQRHFQQLTGPVMAKSLEDTLFYRYGRFLALNEVGGEPSRFGVTPEAFHAACEAQAAAWPNALIASATHDTKRGEDARARLLALSEIPEVWTQAIAGWRVIGADQEAPDANDRYIILQSLLGAWPLELLDHDDPTALDDFKARMGAFLTKALREAKRHSKWVEPNEAYEKAAIDFVASLLTPSSNFLLKFRPLAQRLAERGMQNALARTILKCTLPGVPDIYQGTEFWDFSLVDPDNRRPVDFDGRVRALDEHRPIEALFAGWRSGAIKQRVLLRLMQERRDDPAFYACAGYNGLAADGARKDQVLAFTRQHGDERLLVVVPRLTGPDRDQSASPIGAAFWGDTRLSIEPARWRDVLRGDVFELGGDVRLADLFAALPYAVMRTVR